MVLPGVAAMSLSREVSISSITSSGRGALGA